MSALEQTWPRSVITDLVAWSLRLVLSSLQALIAAPSFLFLLTLGLMLFHPPVLSFAPYDRFAFGLLVAVVLLRILACKHPIRIGGPVTWPLLGLLLLALGGVLTQPYTCEAWSVFAAKWLVPFALFHFAAYVFVAEADLRRFELFSLLVLAYLCFVSICFLCDLRALIFPKFILDENLGIHADRARGPFLQAVANGLALNLLGLLALDSFRRKKLRGVLAFVLLAAIPIAILATKTRAVWLSFAGSIVALAFFSRDRRTRKVCLCVIAASSLALGAMLLTTSHHQSMSDRLEEEGPVYFRMAVYQAGWEMFLSKPILGWSAPQMQAELYRRISEFRQDEYYFHNTFLEILVQHGLLGLSLYLWVMVDLFRLGTKRSHDPCSSSFLDAGFRSLWPLILLVYLVNASFVVMNYQFANGLLFSLAGILNAQNLRSDLNGN